MAHRDSTDEKGYRMLGKRALPAWRGPGLLTPDERTGQRESVGEQVGIQGCEGVCLDWSNPVANREKQQVLL